MSDTTIEEDDTTQWSFDKAINEVFRLLPHDVCSPAPSGRGKRCLTKVEKMLSAENRTTSRNLLPQSEMVQEIVETLAPPEKSRSKGWTVNQQTVTRMSGSKYYTPHSPFFPVKAPTLDQNASSLKISQGIGAMITAKTLET